MLRCMIFFVFFFSSRRRHTRCGRDWSSDVCSSDLSKLTDSRYAVSFTSKCAEDQPVKAGFSHEQKIIRDGNVTVQYTAMGCLGQDDITFKLYSVDSEGNVDSQNVLHGAVVSIDIAEQELSNIAYLSRSEERRVGKECRYRWSQDRVKKKERAR